MCVCVRELWSNVENETRKEGGKRDAAATFPLEVEVRR